MAEGPDQGYAWVVALACFVINFIMAGLARTAGVLYVALIDLYGVSRQDATTPFSIRVCIRNLTGPLIGLLGQKYSIRGIVLAGAIVAALGSIFCSFAPNVMWVTICWGVIHGLGFGLSTVLHMMMLGKYFDKYKASALGLGFSGDCFGTFAFPVIIEHSLASYGLRSTFLILGGIVLNVVPMALLLKEPPWLRRGSKPRKTLPALVVQNNQNSKSAVATKTEAYPNVGLVDKASQTASSDFELLDAVSATGSRRTLRQDLPPTYENVAEFGSDDRVPGGNLLTVGHFNLAFMSSESDISSLNDPIEMNVNCDLKQPSPSQAHKCESKETQGLRKEERTVPPKRNKSFQCFRPPGSASGTDAPCRNGRPAGNLASDSHLRRIQSVSDLNSKEGDCGSESANRTSWSALCDGGDQDRRDSLPPVLERDSSLKGRSESAAGTNNPQVVDPETRTTSGDQNRRDSLPPVLERDSSLKGRSDSSAAKNNPQGVEPETRTITAAGAECPGAQCPKKRTSSFVGSVAQEIVNRLRTASFASQVASDGFCPAIPQDPQSVAEEDESECELRGIVEHRDHDVDCCTKEDLVLSLDKEAPAKDVPEKKQTAKPSVLRQLLRTNAKPMFILISVSMAAYALVFVSVLTIVIDYAKDMGINDEHGKFLIIGFSVTDLFGRLSFGQVIDRKMMKMKNFACSCMLIMGTLVAAIPLNVSFNYMMVCMCMYGFFQGGIAIMFPLLVNLYMDVNEESVAMGCLNFYGGILMLLMAPMIGFYRDTIGSYNCVFYITGGAVAIVSIFWQFEPMIIKYQNKKLKEKYSMKEMIIYKT